MLGQTWQTTWIKTAVCPTFSTWRCYLEKRRSRCKHEADKKDWLAKTQLNNHIREERQRNSHTSEQTHTPNMEERNWYQQIHRQQLILKFWQICTKRGEIAETGRSRNACWIFHNVFTGLSGVQDVLCVRACAYENKSPDKFSILFLVCVQSMLVRGRITIHLWFAQILESTN